MIRAGALAAVFAATALTASGERFAIPEPDNDRRPEVAVRLSWEHRGIPEGMRAYEAAPAAAQRPLWFTSTAARLIDIPAAREYPGGVVKLRPGGSRRLLLVYRNAGKTPVRFFAAPHHVKPEESSLGFEFACLCINHVYTVPPGGYWWRVVELHLGADFSASALEVRHVLLPPILKRTLASRG